MYRVIVKNTNLVKLFESKGDAWAYCKETKANWEDQIDNYKQYGITATEREHLIDMYYSIGVEKIPTAHTHKLENIRWFTYPNAYIVCDVTKEEYGDYMEVARITFNDGVITIRENSTIPEETIERLNKIHQMCIEHKKIQISACGQYITAGENI